jgi:hypothetical protein
MMKIQALASVRTAILVVATIMAEARRMFERLLRCDRPITSKLYAEARAG